MARLPYVDPATAPKEVRQILERLPVSLNIFRMMAHERPASARSSASARRSSPSNSSRRSCGSW